ncbi:efflux transporter outer membrane subunit [Methylobacterium sp. NFXW15]|uniref:efflux transporter outer membrane subunit n=1 Tax=Methylobacterium sp. NFXW15 TaxID=2819512 RepID=UPI003CE8CB48
MAIRFLDTLLAGVTALGLADILGGCVVGPDFVRPVPSVAASATYVEPAPGRPVHTSLPLLRGTTEAPPDVEWWRAFRDPVLNGLEARIAAENLDVQTAGARLLQSRAQLGTSAAAALPTLSGTGSAYRQQFSKNGTIGLLSGSLGGLTGGTDPTAPLTNGFESYTLGFDASWELDLWGRVRRSVESAQAQAEASAERRRAALVSAQGELARDYIQLRGTQDLIRIYQSYVRVNQQILDVVRIRQQKGLVTGLDVASAASQVESIQAQIPQLQQQEIQQINAISLLLGEPPLALAQDLTGGRGIPPVPPKAPVGIPSDLLRRRPDIRQAEASLHAAIAEIGEAEAEFFPRVTLTASPTVNAIDPAKIFRGSSLQYMNIGPSISIPLFEGGRLRSNLVLRQAQQQEAAIAYQKAVLQGWHEVVNALASLQGDAGRRARLARQVGDARRGLDLARARYTQGVEIFTTVLQNAQVVLQAETNLSQANAALSTDFVALSKALGGGWEGTFPTQPTPPGPPDSAQVPAAEIIPRPVLP